MKMSHGLFFTVSAAALLSINSAFGGTLTVTSGPTVTTTGTNNLSPTTSFAISSFNFNGNTAAKLTGTQIYTDNNAATTQNTVRVSLSGNATANAGDFFSLAYDFTLQLTGTGTVTPQVSATASIFGTPVVTTSSFLAASTGTGGTSTFHYIGTTDPSDPAPSGISGQLSAFVEFVWTGAAQGDTLQITVPGNSIDFALAPTALSVPEPASLALLGATGLFVGFRRRR